MHKLNAKAENQRLLAEANAIVAPVLEAGQPAEAESLLSDPTSAGLMVAPVVPALALVQ